MRSNLLHRRRRLLHRRRSLLMRRNLLLRRCSLRRRSLLLSGSNGGRRRTARHLEGSKHPRHRGSHIRVMLRGAAKAGNRRGARANVAANDVGRMRKQRWLTAAAQRRQAMDQGATADTLPTVHLRATADPLPPTGDLLAMLSSNSHPHLPLGKLQYPQRHRRMSRFTRTTTPFQMTSRNSASGPRPSSAPPRSRRSRPGTRTRRG